MSGLNLSAEMLIESLGSRKQYRLLEVLGAGTFGQVWLTSDTSSRALRAVKVILGSTKASILPEVEQHMSALAAAGRAYVPEFYEASVGFCKHDGRSEFFMIAMEYIDGATAWELSKECEMPEKYARVILANTCRAICRLHEHGIVHRDIKAANILVSREGEIKICDFGISTLLSHDVALRQKAGTAAYMAPEICAMGSGSDKYDEKVDVWALGILAMDLALGRLPGDGRRDALRMIHTSSYDVPNVLRSCGFTADYQSLAKACLDRDSQKRPSASELLDSSCLHTPAMRVREFQEWVQDVIHAIR